MWNDEFEACLTVGQAFLPFDLASGVEVHIAAWFHVLTQTNRYSFKRKLGHSFQIS